MSDIPDSIFAYIWQHSKKRQLMLVVGTLIYLPLLYVFFELPKLIINGALQPDAAEFPKMLLGVQVDQVSYLILLCASLLALMLVTAGLRYVLSVQKGVLGEIMLRRIRYDLFSQILRFPLTHFRRVSTGEIVTMATAEAEPLGRYMGVALANPVLQGGTLITAMTFLFVQDWVLGLAAISLFPLQTIVVPKLQRRMNDVSRRRLANLRLFAGHVSEMISGVREIHSHNTSIFERARASHRLGILFRIRRRLYKLGNAIIFLNTFFTQFTPFLFYLIGGYLVIRGDLTLGALVAVIAAYRETVQPWNELLENYQQLEDNRVKYAAMVENFLPPGMRRLPECDAAPSRPVDLTGPLEVSDVTLLDGDSRLIEDLSFSIDLPGRLAIVGPAGSGKSEMAQLLCGLLRPTSGRISYGARDLSTFSAEDIGHCFGYVDQDSRIFTGTWRQNLVYALRRRPVSPIERDADEKAQRQSWEREAIAAGNTTADLDAEWVDYAGLGIADSDSFDERVTQVLSVVGLERDLIAMGLHALPAAKENPALADGLLTARIQVRDRLAKAGLLDAIEMFDERAFNANATVAENFLFGRPTDETFHVENLGSNDFVLGVLAKHDLIEALVEVGYQTALELVEMFQSVESESIRLENFNLIPHDELPKYKSLLLRVERKRTSKLGKAERAMLLALAFSQAPAHARFGLIDKKIRSRIVSARMTLRRELPDSLREKIEFFNEKSVCSGITVQCNVLFGRLAKPQHRSRVNTILADAIASTGLTGGIISLGLESSVGTAGSRLSPAQRQKLAVARCLLKRPSVLIANEAINALDHAEQESVIQRIGAHMGGGTLVWVDKEDGDHHQFQKVMAMRAGRITSITERDIRHTKRLPAGEMRVDTLNNAMRILLASPILDGASPSTTKMLAYAGEQVSFKAGETIMREGDIGTECYFVLKGAAEISLGERRERRVIATRNPGDVIGEMALLLDTPRSATVTAQSDLEMLTLSRELFHDLLRKDHRFGIAIMRSLAQRLLETTSLDRAS